MNPTQGEEIKCAEAAGDISFAIFLLNIKVKYDFFHSLFSSFLTAEGCTKRDFY